MLPSLSAMSQKTTGLTQVSNFNHTSKERSFATALDRSLKDTTLTGEAYGM